MPSSHPISRLVARYGPSHGMYLYGEYCLLEALGFDAFRRRHTDEQLATLASQLAPLSLWPTAQLAPPSPTPNTQELERVLFSLVRPPLRLGLGADLFHACIAWAGSQGDTQADPGAWFEPSRLELTRKLGFSPPPLRVTWDAGLPAHAYRLYVWGEGVDEGEAFPGQDLMRGQDDEAPPTLPYPWSRDPAAPGWVTWLHIGPGATPPPHLERLHWIAAMNRHVTAMVARHADRLLTTSMVHALLEQAEPAGYDHELERYVSLPELRMVFCELVRQRVRLDPAPMLEKMLTSVLADLSTRSLPPSELERLARQLPVFTTQRMVGIVRKGIGLPEEPPPTLTWPAGPPPAPRAAPVVEEPDASRWRELAAAVRAHRPEVSAWVHLLRALVPVAWLRTGYPVRWGLHVPRPSAPVEMPRMMLDYLQSTGRLPQIQRVVERHLAVCALIEEIAAWLAAPGQRQLSAPAQLMLEDPRWPDYAYILAAPGRLLRELGVHEWAETFAGVPTAGI